MTTAPAPEARDGSLPSDPQSGATGGLQGGLHATVVDRLGTAIVRGDFPVGSVLATDELESRLGASRSVIREAVRVLESLGMVRSRRRVGVGVCPRDEWNVFSPLLIRWRLDSAERHDQLRSLSQLRRGFEPVAAELAATHATPAQCADLTGAVMGMTRHARSGDLEAYLAADVLFHRTLLQASGNEMFAALHAVVEEVLAGRTHHQLMPAEPNPDAVRLHGDLAQAVLAGDSAAARAATEQIIDEAQAAMEGD